MLVKVVIMQKPSTVLSDSEKIKIYRDHVDYQKQQFAERLERLIYNFISERAELMQDVNVIEKFQTIAFEVRKLVNEIIHKVFGKIKGESND